MEKFKYAAGMPGYGSQGVDGSTGIGGLSVYITSYDAGSPEGETFLTNRINSNYDFLSLVEPPDHIYGYDDGRRYLDGDLIIDGKSKVWTIVLTNTPPYTDTAISFGGAETILRSDLNTYIIGTIPYLRYSTNNVTTATDKKIIDLYVSADTTSYLTNHGPSTIYKMAPPTNFGNIYYNDLTVGTPNVYDAFTVWTAAKLIGGSDDANAIALVRSTADNNWRLGNLDINYLSRDVKLSLDFTRVGINLGNNTPTKPLEVGGNIGIIGDASVTGTLTAGYINSTNLAVGAVPCVSTSLTGYNRFVASPIWTDGVGLSLCGGTGAAWYTQNNRVSIASPNVLIDSYGTLFLQSTDVQGINKGSQITLGGNARNTLLHSTCFAAIAGRKENGTEGVTAPGDGFRGYLQLSTQNNTGVLFERMRITSDGNVGINTIIPTNKLTVAGSFGITDRSDMYFYSGMVDSATGLRWIIRTNTAIESGANVGSDFEIYRRTDLGADLGCAFIIQRSTGRIGINNVVPGYTVDVTGDINFSGDLYKAGVKMAGTGTVLTIGITHGNGFEGISSGNSADPRLTLSTYINGILKGDGTAISAASAGSDYLTPTGNGSGLTALTGANVTGVVANATLAATATNIAATGITGQVAIANGGTAAASQQNAINNLSGAVTSGYYLRGNGANVVMAALLAADLTGTTLPSVITASSLTSVGTLSSLVVTGTVTASNFILSSDERLKINIKPISTKKSDIQFKQFELKTEPGQIRYGVIAQDLQKTNPELVREDTNGMLSVSYFDLLIKKIAELEEKIKKLEKKINNG